MIRDFNIRDYEAAIALWKHDRHIGLISADGRDEIKRFLGTTRG
jgi:hypothetical protein